jgi:hypothetical protein
VAVVRLAGNHEVHAARRGHEIAPKIAKGHAALFDDPHGVAAVEMPREILPHEAGTQHLHARKRGRQPGQGEIGPERRLLGAASCRADHAASYAPGAGLTSARTQGAPLRCAKAATRIPGFTRLAIEINDTEHRKYRQPSKGSNHDKSV